MRSGAERGEARQGGAMRSAVRYVDNKRRNNEPDPRTGSAFYYNPVTQSPRICHKPLRFVVAFWQPSVNILSRDI